MEKILSILNNLHPEYDYATSENFIEDGLLDSFDMVSLVSELEESFGITIKGIDIIPENFASLERIAQIVEKSGHHL